MALQLSTTVRNAKLDAIETTIGNTGVQLLIYNLSGAAPANCAAAITGDVLATIALPADWMAAAANGSKVMAGTWTDADAENAGVADFFRILVGGVCHMQGTVGQGTGDLQLENTNIAVGQTINITAFTWNEANA